MRSFAYGFLLLGLVACGSNSPSKTAPVASADSHGTLVGTWMSECAGDSEEGYSHETIVITANTLTRTLQTSDDADCEGSTSKAVGISSYTAVKSSIGNQAGFSIDSKLSALTYAFTTAEMVSGANTSEQFGFKDWVLNVPKSVAGKAADEDSETMPTVGSMEYDVVQVSGDQLTFGEMTPTKDGSSAAKRPVSVDSNEVFVKQ